MEQEEVLEIARRLRSELLSSWLDAIPTCIVVINAQRQIVYCNQAFHSLAESCDVGEILGLRPGEALNCIYSRIMKAGCGCSKFCTQCGAAIAILNSLRGDNDCQECHMLCKDSSGKRALDLQVFTKPITFEDQIFTLFTALDISHEKRLHYLQRTFHHNLINEAGGMVTIGSMLKTGDMGLQDSDLIEECSQLILRDVIYHRDMTAAEDGRLTVSPGDVRIDTLLDTLCREMRNQPEARGVEMDVQCEFLEMITDQRLLLHVLRNMLLNALEASPKGERVVLACHQDDGVVITITNKGEMPRDIQLQLFKRYVSTKGDTRGLGTYVIKLFTEEYLNGRVSFSSRDGETRFTLKLPLSL